MQVSDVALQEPEAGKAHACLTDLLTEVVFRARIRPDTALEYVNAAVFRLTGYTPEELYCAADLPLLIVHPEDLRQIEQMLEATDDCDVMNCRFRIVHKDGSVVHTEHVWTIERDGCGHAAAIEAVVSDVTQSVNLSIYEAECETLSGEVCDLNDALAQRMAELTVALERLQSAERLKSEFLSSISHELRTPLVGILGAADALSMPTNDPLTNQQRRRVEIIQDSGAHLLKVIDGLLRYTYLLARRMPLCFGPFRLADVGLGRIRQIASLAAVKGLEVTFRISPEELSIVSDAHAIADILDALLENAVKFTPAGGQIALDIAAIGSDVLLTVADTGIGMIPERIEAMFQPFVQGDGSLARAYDGIGLGLAFVARMTEELGGRVLVQSELGRGTHVTICLPINSSVPD